MAGLTLTGPRRSIMGVTGVIGGRLYALTGYSADRVSPDAFFTRSKKLEVYDPASDTWTMGAPMPSPTDGASGVVLQGKLYVVGGGTGRQVLVYDPASNSWHTIASMVTPHWEFAAVSFVSLAGNPRILSFGGDGADDFPSEVTEVYAP